MPMNHFLNDLSFYEKRSQYLKQKDYSVDISKIDCSSADYVMIPWHWHEEIELIYIEQGTALITCDESSFTATEGDLVFINQLRKHFLSPANKKGFISESIIVHPVFIFGFGQLTMEQKYIAPILQDSSLKWLHISKNDPNYQAYYSNTLQILAVNEAKKPGYELLTKSYVLQIWKLLYDCYLEHNSEASLKLTAQDEHRVKQAILFIQDRYMDAITLDDIASSILVSKSECCRCFKRSLNTTPFEYLMKYRIFEATKHMHRKTPESISEIAGSVGFNNTSYFNKIFKKYMNCTPTEYRASIKKDFSNI